MDEQRYEASKERTEYYTVLCSLFEAVSLFYRGLDVVFHSYYCVVSLVKAVDMLRHLERCPPTLYDVRYILTHL